MPTKDDNFLQRLLATFTVEAQEHIQVIASGLVELEQAATAEARVAKRLGTGRVSVDSAYLLGTGKRRTTIGFGVKDARKANKALGR